MPSPSTGSPSQHDVVIVGGGPAGSAAAIELANRAPALAARTLLIDRAVFPRHKLCGGGIVHRADDFLRRLRVRIDVPAVPIHAIRLEHADGVMLRHRADMFRVVRREEFDHALLSEARRRGIEACEGEAVTSVSRTSERVIVRTATGEFHSRVVIGADGAGSLVRRVLVGGRHPQRFIALESLTPEEETAPEFAAHMAVFDFRPAAAGIRGYAWDFPSLKGGTPYMNRGMGTVGRGRAPLKRVFGARLVQQDVASRSGALEGASAPLYHPAVPQSAERVVLAGDAVGVDPLSGEGISIAIGTGILAAHAVIDAFARDDFTFTGYQRRIAECPLGRTLVRSGVAASLVYHHLDEAGRLPPAFVASWIQG